jgi:hypothetical protein
MECAGCVFTCARMVRNRVRRQHPEIYQGLDLDLLVFSLSFCCSLSQAKETSSRILWRFRGFSLHPQRQTGLDTWRLVVSRLCSLSIIFCFFLRLFLVVPLRAVKRAG